MSREVAYGEKACEVCGAIFQPLSGRSKTCSKKCSNVLKSRTAAERWAVTAEERRKARVGLCPICGREFIRRNRYHVCCSKRCSMLRRYEERKNGTPMASYAGRRVMESHDLEWTSPKSPNYKPMSAALAERLRRALGYRSYGEATAAAMACGQTLTQFLAIEARAAGIEFDMEVNL